MVKIDSKSQTHDLKIFNMAAARHFDHLMLPTCVLTLVLSFMESGVVLLSYAAHILW